MHMETVLKAHASYVAALKSTGAEVIELDPLEAYPDAVLLRTPRCACRRAPC